MLLRFALIVLALGFVPGPRPADVQADAPRPRVAILDFGETEAGRRASDAFSAALAKNAPLRMVDRDLSRSAARGMNYAGSLNLTLEEARSLGAAIGCDFFVAGDAQTLRRSPSDNHIYYEAYASIFTVSARTGALVRWARLSKEADAPAAAEKLLLEELRREADSYSVTLHRWRVDEGVKLAHEVAASAETMAFEDAPDEGSPDAANFRPPQPFRRLHPPYPDTAAAAEAEATVDAQVEIGADGEVARVRVVRWAGFGLDESVADTIQRMHFRPATRDGVGVPVRVLLRYNFRRPPKTK